MEPNIVGLAKTQKEQKVAEEYLSSLTDLNMNSKPLINMLTMLAEENIEYAPVIVKVVEQHIAKVPADFKLPILYLIDSIVKNVKSTYVPLFSQCIVNIFCGVFEKVKENVREKMYALRQTWNEVFALQKLFALDVKIKRMDANWPITAKHAAKSPAIHVNPDFLKTNEMEETLRAKTRELLELKKRKLELELEATKKHLEEQEKQLSKTTESVIAPTDLVTLPDHQPVVTPIAPGMIGATALSQQTAHHGTVRSPIFHNYRHPRPSVISSTNVGIVPNIPLQAFNTAPRPKVYPVNSAMMNSIRHRDPRLARQHQHPQNQSSPGHFQQLGQQSIVPMSIAPPPAPSNIGSLSRMICDPKPGTNVRNEGVRDYARPSKSEQLSRKKSHLPSRNGGSASESKSPTRHSLSGKSTSRPSSKYVSSHSSNNAGSHNSREKNRNRSKNPPLTLPHEKRKTSSKSKTEEHYKADKAAVSNYYKRKSTSPISNPMKIKDAKRSSKPRTYLRKNKSRSSSPETKDVDLRASNNSEKTQVSPLRESEEESITFTAGATKMLAGTSVGISTNIFTLPLTESDQNVKTETELALCKDIDLRQLSGGGCNSVLSSSNSNKTETSPVTAITSNITSKSKKSSSNSMDPTNDENSWSSSSSITFVSETMQQNTIIASQIGAEATTDDVTKKRLSTAIEDMEPPMPKKSKSEKIDALFGTEDVDLRTVIPSTLLTKTQQASTVSRVMTPPPPPMISSEDQKPSKPNENWAKVKGSKSLPATSIDKLSPKKSSLDDVRAKLAKAAKYNKCETINGELSQRSKNDELICSDDTQEGKDENIRTIMLQAQEMLETHGIKDEQYQKIMHTVMSLNEANKLMEAKRRESLGSTEVGQTKIEARQCLDDPEKLAREAILKKRIPKLNREHQSFSDNERSNENSPLYEDKHKELSVKSSGKDKRVKISKWGHRIEMPPVTPYPTSGLMLHQQQQPQKPWMLSQVANNNSKRSFRGSSSQHHQNVGNHRLPTQMPSPWQTPNTSAMPNYNNVGGLVPAPPPPIPPIAPQLITKACNSINNPQAEMMRSITIDGRSKEIRIYDEIAIVFMDWDQPREIGFQAGQRAITIDNLDPIVLQFNDDYKPIVIDGEIHRIRFGFPSRELYIDDHWYEVYFGGPPVSIPLQNKTHLLKAEGPPPQVNIGNLRRDLVVGKINLVVDALIVIPIFLDAKPQTFQLDGQDHIIQFADSLLTVVIDGSPMQVEYGGLPKSMILGEKKYFVRFGALPNGVIPGRINIKDMICVSTDKQNVPTDESSKQPQDIDSRPQPQSVELKPMDLNSNDKKIQELPETTAAMAVVPPLPSAINIDELFQKLVSSGILGTGGGNTASNNNTKISIDKNETKVLSDAVLKDDVKELIKPIDLTVPENIKTRQSGIVVTLYSGMQCSSCGVRFPPEQTIKYSQHLDWHFRQNRRERDSSRKAHSRKWYYDIADWVQYEEIEDIDEREKNFFETQQNDSDFFDETSNQQARSSPAPSCPADPDDVDRVCDMCQEKFEQFYNEDLEEWHLRSALRVDNKTYHPLCYEDYKASLKPPEVKEPEITTVDDDNAVNVVIKIESDDKDILPNTQLIEDDDDDDVIILPAEEPTITEIDDDEEDGNTITEKPSDAEDSTQTKSQNLTESLAKKSTSEQVILNETMESDVEIQEPNIPFTDLDTYVEKESLRTDDTSKSTPLNIRIKEEPKDVEDDEDDGFEDVGTVVVALDEEILITSSDENTQPHTIASTSPAPSPVPVQLLSPKSRASTSSPCQTTPAEESEIEAKLVTADLEQEDIHGLSNADPTPVTVSNLVNRIKINITKSIVPTSAAAIPISSNNSNDNNSSATIVKTNSLNQNELNSSSNNNISTISTIPVLCSGVGVLTSSIPTLGYTNTSSASTTNNTGGFSAISVIGSGTSTKETTVKNISVVGSYNITPTVTVRKSPSPTILEEDNDKMNYELKPELKKVALKKMKKIECGLETSGLCSIM